MNSAHDLTSTTGAAPDPPGRGTSASESGTQAPRVLSTTEAREAIPGLARRFRQEGLAADIVFFGPHRRPAGEIVPVELLEALAPYLEDLVVAHRVRERLADHAGERVSLDELDERLGFTRDKIAAQAAILRREGGLGPRSGPGPDG